MRIPKYKAWDKGNKKIVDVTMILFGSEEIDHSENYNEPYHWDHFELLQYTGLKDKNGVEIYEGYIIKSPDFDNQHVVEYKDIIQSDDMTAPGIGFQFNSDPNEMEIIGNIYENPELLEDK